MRTNVNPDRGSRSKALAPTHLEHVQTKRDYDEICAILRNPPAGADLEALRKRFWELNRAIRGKA